MAAAPIPHSDSAQHLILDFPDEIPLNNGRLDNTEPPGQDDLAIIGLLVIATDEIGDRPDEGGQVLMVHGGNLWRASLDDLQDSL